MITDNSGLIWYRPREIAKLRLITSTATSNSELGNYNYILEQIKAGRLEAINYGHGKVKYYLVSVRAIDKFYRQLTSLVKS